MCRFLIGLITFITLLPLSLSAKADKLDLYYFENGELDYQFFKEKVVDTWGAYLDIHYFGLNINKSRKNLENALSLIDDYHDKIVLRYLDCSYETILATPDNVPGRDFCVSDAIPTSNIVFREPIYLNGFKCAVQTTGISSTQMTSILYSGWSTRDNPSSYKWPTYDRSSASEFNGANSVCHAGYFRYEGTLYPVRYSILADESLPDNRGLVRGEPRFQSENMLSEGTQVYLGDEISFDGAVIGFNLRGHLIDIVVALRPKTISVVREEVVDLLYMNDSQAYALTRHNCYPEIKGLISEELDKEIVGTTNRTSVVAYDQFILVEGETEIKNAIDTQPLRANCP